MAQNNDQDLINKKINQLLKYMSDEDEMRYLNIAKSTCKKSRIHWYDKWDDLAYEQREFYDYIIRENKYWELLKRKESCTNVKYATFSSDLGVVSPSRFTKHIIKGYTPGRIIKNFHPGVDFTNKIYFDENGSPVCIECFCGFDINNPEVKKAIKETYFTQYNDSRWTVSFFSKSGNLFEDSNCYKIVEDGDVLLGYYSINAAKGTAIISAQEYDYSEIDNRVMWCLYSNYVEGLYGSSKDIPPGFKNSPMEQWKYKIYINNKGKYIKYELYKNIEGRFEFINEKQLIK